MNQRFRSLDALRGVAALSVVLWHWKHFFFVGYALPVDFDEAAQPLYSLLRVFYDFGWLAVDLFFLLSGFIFFRLYSQRIENRDISAARFSAHRFSRLYPLHSRPGEIA